MGRDDDRSVRGERNASSGVATPNPNDGSASRFSLVPPASSDRFPQRSITEQLLHRMTARTFGASRWNQQEETT
jgi:hypothetical protein